jgi:hypothetical protein
MTEVEIRAELQVTLGAPGALKPISAGAESAPNPYTVKAPTFAPWSRSIAHASGCASGGSSRRCGTELDQAALYDSHLIPRSRAARPSTKVYRRSP